MSTVYKEYVDRYSRLKYYKAGAIIKRNDERKNLIYFVINGLLKSYYYDDEAKTAKTIVTRFTWEQQICSSTSATIRDEPINRSIVCVENSIILVFRSEHLEQAKTIFNEALSMVAQLREAEFKKQETRLMLMDIADPAKRVEKFLQEFKNIISRTTANDQASFIGLGRSTFIKARASLHKK